MLEQVHYNVNFARPHVVLVGAGASRAATPEGDAAGRRLPVMTDFVEVAGLGHLLKKYGIAANGENFEDLYSKIAADITMCELRSELDRSVFDYFADLRLPETTTVYDHLVLGLSAKDVIATFNWDPFLIQAVLRNRVASPPRLLFLHGNVSEGFCRKDRMHGLLGARCSRCGEPFASVPLLFPIHQKNYESDPSISDAWRYVQVAFSNAFMVSVFGYSAPKTDASAMDLLRTAWGNARKLEQFEFIDIRSEDELIPRWEAFVRPDQRHFDVHRDFSQSWIARHPRRTGEAWWAQYLEAEFIDDERCPYQELAAVQAWYLELQRQEES